MRVILLAAALALAGGAAWAQQTTNVAVTYQAWADLGTGPLLIVSHGAGQAMFAVSGSTAPTLAPELAFPVQQERGTFVNSKTSDHIWVRALTSLPTSVTYTGEIIGP